MLAAPALLFPTPLRILLALGVPLAWLGARRSGGTWIPATPLNTSLLVLLAMTGVSLLATFDVVLSLGKVAGVLLGVIVFWAAARWTTTPARLHAAVALFLCSGAGLAILGLLGANWIDKFAPIAEVTAQLPRVIRGIPGAEQGFQPNAVAGCLLLFVPVQIALLASSAPIRPVLFQSRVLDVPRWVQALLLALTAGTLVLTQSRGAAVGLFVAALAALAWLTPRTRAAAAAVVVAGMVLLVTLGPARVAELAVTQAGPGMASNVSSRTELWSRALYGIQDFPITGMGMNTFRHVMPVLYPMFWSPQAKIAHAHNHLLQAALDLGVPGLVSYVALWLGTGALLVRVYRQSGDPFHRSLAGGLGAGLIAHFAFSMTDAIPLGAKVGILFWMALALAVSLHQIARPGEPYTHEYPDRR
jgi:O-antigen ligase